MKLTRISPANQLLHFHDSVLQNKSIILKIFANCDLQVFVLNGVERINCPQHPAKILTIIRDAILTKSTENYDCLLSRVDVIFSL